MKILVCILCFSLSGCYSIPVGTPKCNAAYERVYQANFKGADAPWWATLAASDAFDKCMKNG